MAADDITDQLAWCLSRFMDATADEIVMQRAKQGLSVWRSISSPDNSGIDLTLLHG